jgi:hypothetical protein
MGRNISIEYAEEILCGHILKLRIYRAVAAAVATVEVATQGTLPE